MAIFAIQVNPAIAHEEEDTSPPFADSGILSSTMMMETRYGDGHARRKAVQGDADNIFTLDPELCSEFVDCYNGMERNTNRTCFEACDGECCTYYSIFQKKNTSSCGGIFGGFTGQVCKDGKSCTGYVACENAILPFVKNSCIGDLSCKNAGHNGTVGNVTNSCEGRSSCEFLGADGGIVENVYASCKNGEGLFPSPCMYLGRSGKVGNVELSCEGYRPCVSLGHSGKVGNVELSCKGYGACFNLGYIGNVGNINASCNLEKACGLLGWNGKEVGNIENSCIGYQSCAELGLSGKVGSIVNSCNATTACASLGRNGTVGGLKNSCNDTNACESAGTGTLSHVGKISGGIENSCNSNMACMHAGQATCSSFECSAVFADERSCEYGTCLKFFGGGITSKLSNCCNSDKACITAKESSVPMACRPPSAEVRISSLPMPVFCYHYEIPQFIIFFLHSFFFFCE